jgi:uncharacterized protein
MNRPTTTPRVFLTARWTDVLLVSYRVPPNLLQPHVPPGTTLDTVDDAPGAALLSAVALRFRDTRVRGVPILTAQDFAELNLRFYVRHGERRASVFLREYVPAPAIILGARLSYRQPYVPARITHTVERESGHIRVRTRFRTRGHRGGFDVTARDTPFVPGPSDPAHALKERYWGVHADGRDGSFIYRVEHPVWATYPVEQFESTLDPGALLGEPWRTIDWDAARHSVIFAAGSDARVFDPEPLVPARESVEGGPS